MTTTFYWILLVVSVLVLAICRKAVASWFVGITESFRGIDDWSPTLMAILLFVLMMMTIGAASWMPYAWLSVCGPGTIVGLTRMSPWKGNPHFAATW